MAIVHRPAIMSVAWWEAESTTIASTFIVQLQAKMAQELDKAREPRETSKPGTAAACGDPRESRACHDRASGVPTGESTTRYAALPADTA